jgi:hypothetical protein
MNSEIDIVRTKEEYRKIVREYLNHLESCTMLQHVEALLKILTIFYLNNEIEDDNVEYEFQLSYNICINKTHEKTMEITMKGLRNNKREVANGF